jgi:hypothetical protein
MRAKSPISPRTESTGSKRLFRKPDELALRREPDRPVAAFEELGDPVAGQTLVVRRVEDRETCAVEADQAVECADPEVAVPRLEEGRDRIDGESVLGPEYLVISLPSQRVRSGNSSMACPAAAPTPATTMISNWRTGRTICPAGRILDVMRRRITQPGETVRGQWATSRFDVLGPSARTEDRMR